MSINLKSLIGRLNDTTRGTLEAAAGLCLSRTHYDIEPEHFLLKLLDRPDSDVSMVLKHFGIDKSKLTADLNRSIDKFKSGNARTPAISPSLLRALTEGWTIGSLNYSAGQVRSGFVLLALLTEDDLSRLIREISPREVDKINIESLRKDFFALTQMSAETASPLILISTPRILRGTRVKAKSIPYWDATLKFGRSSTSSCAAGRTILSSRVKQGWERLRWWRVSPCVWPMAMFRLP